MKLGFLLAILLLASCNSEAKGRPSNENTLPQVQLPAGVFGGQNEKTFQLFILLGALPVTLICSYEICRSIRVRRLRPRGSSHRAKACASLAFTIL
jgi:hypothetical protein